MRIVNIALLGSGFVAEFFMQGLANVNGQRVVVNYSRSRKRAEEFARRWSIPNSATNLKNAVERSDIDLYLIALPNEEHLPVALLLARHEKNQVCTKPLARNPREARAMLKAAAKSGKMHGYAETEVFAPAVVKAKETIEQGGIGKVLWVRSRESHSGPHSPHFWDVAKTGGGALHDLGCHCVEAARYFFGKDDAVVEVMAWGATLVHHKKTKGEDNALLLLRFAERWHCSLRTLLDDARRLGPSQRNPWIRGLVVHGCNASDASSLLHTTAGRLCHRESRPRLRLDSASSGRSFRLRLSGRDAALCRMRS